jgi:glycine cleavage system H protein
MSEIPQDLHFSRTHEWLRLDGEGTYAVGITDYAQSQLGDLVFVELPDVNADVHAGDEIVVVESVKTAADVLSPISGNIIEVNEALANDPGRVNQDPYNDGWLFRIKASDEAELDDLLTAEAYEAEINDNED